MRERFIGREAEAGAAGGYGKFLAGVEEGDDIGGVGAETEKHGDGFVDGAGRKICEPGIADAPGGEGGDGERHGGTKLATNGGEKSGIERALANGGVKINLNGADAGKIL